MVSLLTHESALTTLHYQDTSSHGKVKESTRVLIALAAAIIVGALVAASGSARLLDIADALAPLGTLWVNAIRMTVIPLVVSLLITGVASATDIGAIGRLGGRTLLVLGLLPA